MVSGMSRPKYLFKADLVVAIGFLHCLSVSGYASLLITISCATIIIYIYIFHILIPPLFGNKFDVNTY